MGFRLVKTPIAATVLALGLLGFGGLIAGIAQAPGHASSPLAAHPNSGPVYSRMPALGHAESTHPAAQSVTISFTQETPPTYTLLGASVGITLSFFNVTVNNVDANMSISLYADLGSSAPYLVAPFASWAVPIPGTNLTSYSTAISAANAAGHTTGWTHGLWPAATEFYMTTSINLYPGGNASNPGNQTPLTSSAGTLALTEIIVNNPWATLVSPNPAPGSPEVSPGNVSVAIQYSGDAIHNASISIVNSGKSLVYSQGLTSLFAGNVTSVSPAPWLVVTPGVYTATITLTADYNATASWSWAFTFTVAKTVGASSLIWLNSTLYKNGSSAAPLISGLSNGATGALLMVVGVIIGLVVALVLGRMMWGSGPATPPAQPWSGSKSATECSVCHQSFATVDEMKEHQKTAHGM